jgi:hypothetical protein
MSGAEVVIVAVPARQRKYRSGIPEAHRKSLDTRLAWLWHQRFGTVQTIWQKTDDTYDKTACTLVLQAIMASDLESIRLIFDRLEGGVLEDTVVLEREDGVLKL